MAPRALGALFALVAALLFATSLAGGLVPKVVPGWWDGHPVVNGRELELKAIHVGLIEAYGCNLGGEVKCEELETHRTQEAVAIAELAALGLGVLTSLLLAASAARIGDRRRLLAKLLLFELLLISAGATTIFFRGPDLRIAIQVAMPVGIGLLAVGGGVGAALLAAIAAFRVQREPLRLRPSLAGFQQQQHRQAQQPAFDVRELLREGQGGTPQPVVGALERAIGTLDSPRPASPRSHSPSHTPLFESAPALRPLYDMQNAGAAPTAIRPSPPPPLEPPSAPHVHDAIASGDSASAHVPVPAFEAADPFAPIGGGGRFPAPPSDHAGVREATPLARAPRQTGAPRPRVPAPERGARSTKQPTLAAAVPPPPTYPEPAELSTTVEVDAEAKARYQAQLARATRQAGPRSHAPAEQNLLGGGDEATGIFASAHATNETSDEATSETQSAPERLDERADDIGFAHTQLAPVLTQQQLADLPSSEQPPIDPPPPVESALRTAARPRSPALPGMTAARAPDPSALPPSRPGPPPKPTSSPPTSAPVAAPFSTRESAPTIGVERIEPEQATDSAVVVARDAATHDPAPLVAAARDQAPDPSAPAAPFPVSPSAAHVAPIVEAPIVEAPIVEAPPPRRTAPLAPLAAKNGPVTASRVMPSPRIGKPTVPAPASALPRPAKLTSTPVPGASRSTSPPPLGAPGLPPARPSAMPSKLASNSSAAAPFASIPSPFASSQPSLPVDEAPTRRVDPQSDEAPTTPATSAHPAPAPGTPSQATPPAPRLEVSSASDEAPAVHAPRGLAAPAAAAGGSRATPPRSASTTVQPRPSSAVRVSISTAPSSLPPPKQAAASGPTPACPQCEAPMAWVDEHLRFYCASCRMYF